MKIKINKYCVQKVCALKQRDCQLLKWLEVESMGRQINFAYSHINSSDAQRQHWVCGD